MTRRTFLSAIAALAVAALVPFRAKAEPKVPAKKDWTRTVTTYRDEWPNRPAFILTSWVVDPVEDGAVVQMTYESDEGRNWRELPPPKHWTMP